MRILIELRDGEVVAAHADQPFVEVDILDHDAVYVGDGMAEVLEGYPFLASLPEPVAEA